MTKENKLYPNLQRKSEEDLRAILRQKDMIRYLAKFEKERLLDMIKKLKESIKSTDFKNKFCGEISKNSLETELKKCEEAIYIAEAETALSTELFYKPLKNK